MRLDDLTGRVFGRLTALRRNGTNSQGASWKCRCECGQLTTVRAAHLKNGNTKSCGCLREENVRTKAVTHGATVNGVRTPEYTAWLNIIQRCTNPNSSHYEYYGGRGITVSARWLKSYAAFFAHIGLRPSPSHSVDRIKNHLGYKPGNVRWATKAQQTENQRKRAVVDRLTAQQHD